MFKKIVLGLFLTVFLAGCSSIDVKKINENNFVLIDSYSEPPTGFESSYFENKSWQVCPQGFHPNSKKAFKQSEFGVDHAQCANNLGCDYIMEWNISCVDRPREEFTIFGNH